MTYAMRTANDLPSWTHQNAVTSRTETGSGERFRARRMEDRSERLRKGDEPPPCSDKRPLWSDLKVPRYS
jgi:hypothetical protein